MPSENRRKVGRAESWQIIYLGLPLKCVISLAGLLSVIEGRYTTLLTNYFTLSTSTDVSSLVLIVPRDIETLRVIRI